MPRRLVRRRLESGIAAASSTAPRRQALLARFDEIGQEMAQVGVADHCPNWDAQHTTRSIAPFLIAAAPVLAAACLVSALISEIQQRSQTAVGRDDNVSPFAPIASVRPSLGHEFLPPEAHAPTAAVSRCHKNFRFIDEH
jgi:hypothetical protein